MTKEQAIQRAEQLANETGQSHHAMPKRCYDVTNHRIIYDWKAVPTVWCGRIAREGS